MEAAPFDQVIWQAWGRHAGFGALTKRFLRGSRRTALEGKIDGTFVDFIVFVHDQDVYDFMSYAEKGGVVDMDETKVLGLSAILVSHTSLLDNLMDSSFLKKTPTIWM